MDHTRYTIDIEVIRDNLAIIRQQLPDATKLMFMVKSNAYGVGDVALCQALGSDLDMVGVATIQEAQRLRAHQVSSPVFLFHASENQLDAVLDSQVQLGVSRFNLLQALDEKAARKDTVAVVHVHLDTGMTRLGACYEESLAMARYAHSSPHLRLNGLMTHFPCADEPSQDPFSQEQSRQLNQITSVLTDEGISPPLVHMANSAAAVRLPIGPCNMVRIGIQAYGIAPSAKYTAPPTRCALTLETSIIDIAQRPKGTGVSYGLDDRIDHESGLIATIPVGYYDGIHRRYRGAELLINGQRAPIVGNVTMDFTMLDVSHIDGVRVGDKVTIFGYDDRGNYADPLLLAEKSGTIAHELITCIGPRIRRTYLAHHKEPTTYDNRKDLPKATPVVKGDRPTCRR